MTIPEAIAALKAAKARVDSAHDVLEERSREIRIATTLHGVAHAELCDATKAHEDAQVALLNAALESP